MINNHHYYHHHYQTTTQRSSLCPPKAMTIHSSYEVTREQQLVLVAQNQSIQIKQITIMSSKSSVCSLVAKESSFVDESTECAIYYDSLETRLVITLRCGHKWHLDCIEQQIEIGSMTASNDDKRLLFHGCQCGKCGSIFGEEDHPDLPMDLIRSTDKLRSKVHDLIDEHNLRNEMELVHAASGKCKELSREALCKEAMRKYAFYLCSHCKDPYFGGTIACADGLGPSETESVPETRLCPACAPQSQTICQNPSEHGRCIIRYSPKNIYDTNRPLRTHVHGDH